MATKIEWTRNQDGSKGETWNPIVGCSIKSPDCINCYAMKDAWRKGFNPNTPQYHGLTEKVNGKAVWNGTLRFVDHKLTEPLKRKKPTTYFVNSMSDLFHEEVADEWIDRVFAVVALSPQHTFQVQTKRAERMREYCSDSDRKFAIGEIIHQDEYLHNCRPDIATLGWMVARRAPLQKWPLPNVWLGVSAERQQEADERREPLRALAEQRWLTFVSYEPALGPVDWSGWEFLRWLISGGESGHDARASHPDWHRAARDWCAANDVEFFFKQWGEWAPARGGGRHHQVLRVKEKLACPVVMHPDGNVVRVGKKAAGRLLDGKEHNGMPSQVRA
jgi:protein gp37